MSFTRQYSIAGPQNPLFCSFPINGSDALSANHRSFVSISNLPAGNRGMLYDMPGFVDGSRSESSTTCSRMSAQTYVSMKNARKAGGLQASDKTLAMDPILPNVSEDQQLLENRLFSEKPSPRQPESPEVESLRSLLKASLSREKASPALLQRIRSRMHEKG